MKNVINIIGVFFIAVILYSCGAGVGEEVFVESSGEKPDWLYIPTSKDNQFVSVIGEMSHAKDRSFGMNQAYADGIRKLLNMMINDVKTQSSQVLKGSNLVEGDVERYSEFAVAWISQTYTVANVQNPESYWKKIRVGTSYGEEYYYDCFTKIQITSNDFNMSMTGAYENMKKKAKENNNKTAEDVANKLIDDLRNGK
jgi:hypothetical protein